MGRQSCRACGAALQRGETSCPHCGARVEPVVSRLWVLAFFVMGVMIGLLLLVLQEGGLGAAISALKQEPAVASKSVAVTSPAKAPAKTQAKQKPRKPPAPTPTPESAQGRGEVEPPPASASAVVEPLKCDRAEAHAIRDKARTLALISEQGDELTLQLNENWAYYSPGLRRSFAVTFADADRCLSGRARVIHFSFRGEEVALVSREGALEMK